MSASPIPPPLLPQQRVTAAQLRALHAAARRRGLTHEDLRAAGGVGSLTELTRANAARILENLNADRPEPTRRRPHAPRGVVRPASPKQRGFIWKLLADLPWSAERTRTWLRDTHGVSDVNTHPFSTATASALITQLQQIHKHAAPGRVRPDGRNA